MHPRSDESDLPDDLPDERTADLPGDLPGGLLRGLLIAGIVLIALNLRPALAGVGPLVSDIRAATGLSNAAFGFLTTLPLLAFGAISAFTPLVSSRFGMERALALALVLICCGTAIRAITSVGALFGGTLLFGVGIALGNVLLPALVKRDFPERSGLLTSLYSSMMGLGAAVAAGVSVPLSAVLGWRGALGIWAVPAAVALVIWLPQLRYRTVPRLSRTFYRSIRGIGRSPLAWHVALFMGLQSLTFYVVLAWLPDLLQSQGYSASEAGWLLALSQATGIAGTGLIPLWGGRLSDHRPIVVALVAAEALAIAGLLAPTPLLTVLSVGLLGFVLGGSFGLALLLLVVRAPDSHTATVLSGMAQSVGYLLAAIGPAVFGLVHDLTSGWTAGLLFLMGVLLAKSVFGLRAGRPGEVPSTNGATTPANG